MSQAPHPFTQAASQGYGEFQETVDEDDDNEGPQSPEPEQEEQEEQEQEEEEMNEAGFTQTQERDYPTADDDDDDNDGPASPPVEQDDDDDEEPDEKPSQQRRKVQIMNDSDDEEDESDKKSSQQRRKVQIMNDSDEEDEEPHESTSVIPKEKNRNFLKQFTMKNEESPKKHKKRHTDEHHEKKTKRFREEEEEEQQQQEEEQQEDENVDDVVDDIFGKDMDDQAEVAAELADLNDPEVVDEEEDEEEEDQQQETFDDEGEEMPRKESFSKSGNVSYDIDLYLEKQAEKRRGNRRRGGGKNGDVDLAGPDSDQIVSHLINKMKIATEEDRVFNKNRQPATAKLLLLPVVEQQMCRADLSEIFLDNGILNVFKDWLSPLPDKSLPNIKIRESLIRILQQFGVIHADPLRDSGIGKALMYLYKHPRETKENKIKLIKIIHDWARPIFNLDTDYKHLTREERQQRDADQATLKRQTSLTSKTKTRSADVDLPFASNRADDDLDNDDCPRARVPRPSNKDYLVRPVSTVEYSEKRSDGKKKTISRLDEVKRRQQERQRNSKPMSIVKLSIEGNKMHL